MKLENLKSEYEIECWVELNIDRLDAKYMRGRISTATYKELKKDIYFKADKALSLID